MELKKIGIAYTLIAFVLSVVMGYSISIISPTIEFLTMFSSLFIVLIIMKLVILLLIKIYLVDKLHLLKDEIKRFNFIKAEQKPQEFECDCILGQLSDEIYEYQNKNLDILQTLERELEHKNDTLRENQYYIEHLESAILKSKKEDGEDDDGV